jgi:hypothetical protein
MLVVLHSNLEQVAEANLSNIVCDILIVQQVGIIHVGSIWLYCGIGLCERVALEPER